jgi:hypothetical protein
MREMMTLIMVTLLGCSSPSVQVYHCTATVTCDTQRDVQTWDDCGTEEEVRSDEENWGTACYGLLFTACGSYSCEDACSPTGQACERGAPVDGGVTRD